MIIKIDEATKKIIQQLVTEKELTVEFDSNPESTFVESAYQSERKVVIREQIDTEEFDYLSRQHNSSHYEMNSPQEMFIFNALHGIGHFELGLWSPQTPDPLVNRLTNFDQDVAVDKWAYQELIKFRIKSARE